MRKTIIILLSLLSMNLFAGRYAGDFMEIGSGVKALGMGGAFSAIADDGSAVYWNVAGLSQITSPKLSLMRAFLYEGMATYDHLTYCQPLPNEVTIGINWTRLTIDDIPVFGSEHLQGTTVDQRIMYPQYQLTGDPDDMFSSKDDLFQIGFSKKLSRMVNIGWLFFEIPFDFHFGGNFKYIKRDIYDNLGVGTGFDFAMLTKTELAVIFDYDWMGTLACGVNFQDIGGTVITWDTVSEHEDEILFNTKLGFALEQPISAWKSMLVLSADHDYVYGGTSHYGLEYGYDKMLFIRGGLYNDDFSAGMGLKLYGVTLDYAFVTNNLGNTNRVGVKVEF